MKLYFRKKEEKERVREPLKHRHKTCTHFTEWKSWGARYAVIWRAQSWWVSEITGVTELTVLKQSLSLPDNVFSYVREKKELGVQSQRWIEMEKTKWRGLMPLCISNSQVLFVKGLNICVMTVIVQFCYVAMLLRSVVVQLMTRCHQTEEVYHR